MEPEEGKYAWIYNENYRALIQGALDRGLKLAFRIYDNGESNLRPGTPDFVRQAGAKGYTVTGSTPAGDVAHWTPYVDDPVFQEKLGNFVRAFAAAYDNPDIVDFVDGVNVGWWGEIHDFRTTNYMEGVETSIEEKDRVLEWLTNLYGSAFRKVILVMPVFSGFTHNSEMRIAVGKHGYGFRRDGLGSWWFQMQRKDFDAASLFPSTLLIGESNYWQGNEFAGWVPEDKYHNFTHWRQVYEATYTDAIDYHFNTLDLREPLETRGWTSTAPDLVQDFIKNGGYRLYPVRISAPGKMNAGGSYTIKHWWRNLATGVCPNNNPRWNYKYKVAFALINSAGEVIQKFVDTQSDPSTFIKGVDVAYTLTVSPRNDVPQGVYSLGVAIVDTTKDNTPGIQLAVENKEIMNGWTVVSSATVE
jgi:hypothetical protein